MRPYPNGGATRSIRTMLGSGPTLGAVRDTATGCRSTLQLVVHLSEESEATPSDGPQTTNTVRVHAPEPLGSRSVIRADPLGHCPLQPLLSFSARRQFGSRGYAEAKEELRYVRLDCLP